MKDDRPIKLSVVADRLHQIILGEGNGKKKYTQEQLLARLLQLEKELRDLDVDAKLERVGPPPRPLPKEVKEGKV
jgi:hypothetical protein